MITISTKICPVCGSDKIAPFTTCKDYFCTGRNFDIHKCKQCDFEFTQDFPSENEIGKYYQAQSYVSHSDTQKGIINKLYHFVRKVALKSKSEIVRKYSAKKTGLLLDIGCGTGYFLNTMRQLKWVVTGVEKSDSAKEYAKTKFGLDIQEPDCLYRMPENSKDVITMWHVLEHIEDLNKLMHQLHFVLKDDGAAIIAIPNKASFDAQHYKEYWAAYDVPRHLWHFSPSNFEILAKAHQLELVAIKPMHFDTFYISMLSEKNKGTILGTLIGLIKGSWFFFLTLFNKKKSSSLTYILKKKAA